MPYNTNVPNQNQSPGDFPAQNNENFTRLQDIINNDHNFTNSSSASQGIHKQVTLINYSNLPVGALPAGNGILYSYASHLFWYNGTANYQITPQEFLLPIRVVGSQSVAAGNTVTAFADPGYQWAGSGFATISGSSTNNCYNLIMAAGGGSSAKLVSTGGAAGGGATFAFSGNDLTIRNILGSTFTLKWSLIINRLN